jgi:hypothetical protein
MHKNKLILTLTLTLVSLTAIYAYALSHDASAAQRMISEILYKDNKFSGLSPPSFYTVALVKV